MINMNDLKAKIGSMNLKDSTGDVVAVTTAVPGELAKETLGAMGEEGQKTADISKDLKVPEGVKLGAASFVVKEGTIPAHSKVANEKNPIIVGGGERFELGSTTPLPKEQPKLPAAVATYAKKREA